jgi:hypothetical protein
MNNKERLKPLSLYGYDLEEAIRAILSVNPKKLTKSRGKKQRDKKSEISNKQRKANRSVV